MEWELGILTQFAGEITVHDEEYAGFGFRGEEIDYHALRAGCVRFVG